MRVEILDYHDFISEAIADKDLIRGGILRYRRDISWHQKEQIDYDAIVWLTAVVDLEAGSHLLECCEILDGKDKDKIAAKILGELDKAAQEAGLEVRPGKVERY